MPDKDEDIHSLSIGYLDESGQGALLSNVLRSLGLIPEEKPVLEGMSGLKHRSVLVGYDHARKHAVIVQRGMEKAYGFRQGPRRHGDEDRDSLSVLMGSSNTVAIAQREDLIRREVLFQGYDIQGRIQVDGYTCDLLFFLNSAPLETLGIDRYDFREHRFIAAREGDPVPFGLGASQQFSRRPIDHLQRAELAQNALGMGACFLALDDFSCEQLSRLTATVDESSQAEAKAVLRKLRVYQYFEPPADEFVLGLSALPIPVSSEILIGAAQLSVELNHPLGSNVLLYNVNTDNPLEVAQALVQEGRLHYKGTISYPTEAGAQVVHEIETRPQQSWLKKIGGLVGLLAKARGLFGSP